MIKIASQFSGIGAFEQAITNLGIEHENIMAVDFDKYARQTYTANFGEPKHYFVDSYNADYENVENVDVFLSSPPCQSFSLAGKRLGESDPRGLLFFETLRFVKCNKPKYFIIENVKGLLSMDDGEVFRNWIQLLGQSENGNTFMFPHEDSLMYNLHWQVLNTKDYGLPQNRERVFLVGIRNDLPNSFVFPKGVPLKLRLKDILEDNVDEKYYLSDLTCEKLIRHNNPIIENQNPEISGTIHAGYFKMGGRDQQYLKVQSATKSGYEIATEGDGINLEHPNSETRRGRVGKQVAQTLTTSCNQGVMIGAMRGRNLENPSDRTPGAPTQQMLEINENGTSNCLTSVQKDNLVVENKIIELNSKKLEFNGFHDTVSPTLLATDYKAPKCIQYSDFRIRKLTVRECARLQGFPEEFDLSKVSNSQGYKQMGNTISVNVIQAILKNLLK